MNKSYLALIALSMVSLASGMSKSNVRDQDIKAAIDALFWEPESFANAHNFTNALVYHKPGNDEYSEEYSITYQLVSNGPITTKTVYRNGNEYHVTARSDSCTETGGIEIGSDLVVASGEEAQCIYHVLSGRFQRQKKQAAQNKRTNPMNEKKD